MKPVAKPTVTSARARISSRKALMLGGTQSRCQGRATSEQDHPSPGQALPLVQDGLSGTGDTEPQQCSKCSILETGGVGHCAGN